jgi:hypothetical protein
MIYYLYLELVSDGFQRCYQSQAIIEKQGDATFFKNNEYGPGLGNPKVIKVSMDRKQFGFSREMITNEEWSVF